MKTKENKRKGTTPLVKKKRNPEQTAEVTSDAPTIDLFAPSDVSITLTVKAKQLFSLPGYNQFDINNLCELTDGIEVSPYGANKDNFVSEVSLGKDVFWRARSADPSGEDKNYEVKITAYDYKQHRSNNTNFFVPDRIEAVSNLVTGHVKNDVILKTKEDTYAIEFRITDTKTKKYSDFIIDPKLKVNPYKLYAIPHEDDASRISDLDDLIDQQIKNV